MRLLPLAILVMLVLLPAAAAETWQPRALGASMGLRSGAMGLQFDDEGAFGIRYYNNVTVGGDLAFVLTVCYVPDGAVPGTCAWYWLRA